MFEPRGHDQMSGSFLYPPSRPDCDVAVLFIESSGCLPMFGHATIGTVTFSVERGLVPPSEPSGLRMQTAAGTVDAAFTVCCGLVASSRITNRGTSRSARHSNTDRN